MYGKRPTMMSMHGMVAAAHPLAAAAGARILAEGGNAFDAAAATGAALNVVEPFMSGLAGMGLATCWVAKEKKVRALDFVAPIPARFPVDRLRKREELARGALSVGAPGNFLGWAELVRAHGTKTLAQVLAPAIALARDGYAHAEFGVYETNETEPDLARHPALYATWAETYTGGRKRIALGDILRQPDLASTFEALGREGPEHLTRGPLGERIVAHLESLGGCLGMDDLAAMRPAWKEPLRTRYRGLDVHAPPPSCEGFQFLLTLAILEGFDLAGTQHLGVEHLDTVYRAIRLAAGERLAENNPSPERLAHLFSAGNLERLAARVRDPRPITGPTEQWTAPDPTAREGHTTSFSIADREGNLVCITNSLGSPYGSGVVVPGTGVCLNNFLYWAEVTPESPNRARPGGALAMCVSPTIATRDGVGVLALGTPGSYGILQTQVQAYVHHLDFGLPLQEAIEAPRARLWDGRRVEQEDRLPAGVVEGLSGRGHAVERVTEGWTMRCGGMQAVARDPVTGLMTGACDPRRDGYVATP
jgi:gamma-glutamyltranspeptidase/glutathione hydrolase